MASYILSQASSDSTFDPLRKFGQLTLSLMAAVKPDFVLYKASMFVVLGLKR